MILGRHARLCIALVAVLLPASGDSPRPRSLQVLSNSAVVWSTPLGRDRLFDISYTHSAELCRWTHHYAVSSGVIRQRGSTFPCFGAGMPSDSTDGTPVRRSADGYTVAAPRVLAELRMMNWRPATIAITVDGRQWPLGEWLPDYAEFVVRVR